MKGAIYDPVWNGVRFDTGERVADQALAEAYAIGYKRGREEAIRERSSVMCVCCGDIIGPSAPHNETRCGTCRHDCWSLEDYVKSRTSD